VHPAQRDELAGPAVSIQAGEKPDGRGGRTDAGDERARAGTGREGHGRIEPEHGPQRRRPRRHPAGSDRELEPAGARPRRLRILRRPGDREAGRAGGERDERGGGGPEDRATPS
jgi:hypothetical protein